MDCTITKDARIPSPNTSNKFNNNSMLNSFPILNHDPGHKTLYCR